MMVGVVGKEMNWHRSQYFIELEPMIELNARTAVGGSAMAPPHLSYYWEGARG